MTQLLFLIIGLVAGGLLVRYYFPRVETKIETKIEQVKAEVEEIPAYVLTVVHSVEQKFSEASGEAKRHQALALLKKAGFTERQAAQWIEKAIDTL